jgi:hypothetical protein
MHKRIINKYIYFLEKVKRARFEGTGFNFNLKNPVRLVTGFFYCSRFIVLFQFFSYSCDLIIDELTVTNVRFLLEKLFVNDKLLRWAQN